jgi:hypothetical protein
MPLQTSYTQFQPAGYPGMHADMSEWDAETKTATAQIAFGAPVQRNGDSGCAPLTSGEFLGIAIATHLVTGAGDVYAIGDNVPVADEGKWYGLADAAITAGAALNWNATSGRWTTATATGSIYAVPQAEADNAASGAGVIFKVRLRRIPS